MEKLYALPSLKRLKAKYEVSTLMPMGQEWWMGELNNSKYHVIIAVVNRTIKIKIAETELGLMKKRVHNIAKINNQYAGLAYLTQPINNCAIKLVLDLLEWEYDDDDIWC